VEGGWGAKLPRRGKIGNERGEGVKVRNKVLIPGQREEVESVDGWGGQGGLGGKTVAGRKKGRGAFL